MARSNSSTWREQGTRLPVVCSAAPCQHTPVCNSLQRSNMLQATSSSACSRLQRAFHSCAQPQMVSGPRHLVQLPNRQVVGSPSSSARLAVGRCRTAVWGVYVLGTRCQWPGLLLWPSTVLRFSTALPVCCCCQHGSVIKPLSGVSGDALCVCWRSCLSAEGGSIAAVVSYPLLASTDAHDCTMCAAPGQGGRMALDGGW